MSNSLLMFPDVCERYIKQSGKVRTKSTAEQVTHQLRVLQRSFPNLTVNKVTTNHLTEHCLALTTKGLKPAPGTINLRKTILRSVFSWCHFQGWSKKDPSADLKFTVTPGTAHVRSGTWLSLGEVGTMLGAMPSGTLLDRRNRVLMATGFMTGLRASELVGLRWSMFRRDLSEIELVGKKEKLATIGVPDSLHEILSAWRHETRQHQGADGPLFPTFRLQLAADGESEEFVVQWHRGLKRGGLVKVVARAGVALDRALGRPTVKKLAPHDMRRTYCNVLDELGLDVKEISLAMRHSNVATTNTYLDRSPSRAAAVGRTANWRIQ